MWRRSEQADLQPHPAVGESLLASRGQTDVTVFYDVRVWTSGMNAPPKTRRDQVLIIGNRIHSVAIDGAVDITPVAAMPQRWINGDRRILMPGLIDGHAHLSFHDITRLEDAGDLPPEENLLWTQYNALAMLDAGFTSCFSAASSRMRLDVVVRDEINAGRIKGPRLRAASPEITATGSLGDVRQMHQTDRTSIELISDSPDEMRRLCRTCVREGVDTIKINIGGETLTPTQDDIYTTMTEDEIAAAVQVAHSLGVFANFVGPGL
jgi:imidazolonepropionase-like amidohydrolase